MKTVKLIALFLALLLAPPAHAEFLTGETLHRLLNATEEAKNQAMGYVVGVHDATRGTNGHCSADNLSAVALTGEVKSMLQEIGDLRATTSADVLILTYLKLKYPCGDKGPTSVQPGTMQRGLRS